MRPRLAFLFCVTFLFLFSAVSYANAEEGKRIMAIDESGEISGFRFSIEEAWLDTHGRVATLALALENITSRELELRFDGLRKHHAVHVWTPQGVLLSQSPTPPPNQPLSERGRMKLVTGIFKPGDRKVFIKVSFPELNKYVFAQPVLVQVYHYSQNDDYILMSPPILLDPQTPHFIRSVKADSTAPNATDAGKQTKTETPPAEK